MAGVNTMMNNQFQLGQSGKLLLGTLTGLEKFLQDPYAGVRIQG